MKSNRSRSQARGRVRNRTRAPLAALGIVALAVVALSLLGLSGLFTSANGKGTPAPTSGAPTSPASGSESSPLPRSVPTRLTITSIGVNSGLQTLGMSKDKQQIMELPPNPKQAGWYQPGPTPGQAGPTIIVGYIASPHGPGVFRRLANLHKQDTISVTRSDGKIVSYRVDKIASYTKDQFPTDKVYTTDPEPVLRLITCGGTLHPKEKPGNVVVYAHQVTVTTPAPLKP
jgi:sortase (surface protein transpeptidase)